MAYACNPLKSSEPGVGWNFVLEASQFSTLWVVVQEKHRKAIEEALPTLPKHVQERVQWIFVDVSRWLWWIRRKFYMGTQVHFAGWQWKAFFVARKLHKQVHFDLTHHLTFGICWLAPPLSLIPAPFIWGPIGGGDPVPWRFLSREKFAPLLWETLYGAINVVTRISPLSLIARRRAKAILFRTSSTEKNFPRSPNARRIVMCETAMHALPKVSSVSKAHTFTVACVGRLMCHKGSKFAVMAFHRYLERGGEGELILLGDGPQREEISNYVIQNGLGSHIHLRGKVPSQEVQELLERAHVLLHPSFREGGSWSIMEAMSKGLPVICVNRSGMADMVDEACGIRLQAKAPEQLVVDIADALKTLADDPLLRRSLGDAARQRMETAYTWKQRGIELSRIYGFATGKVIR